MTKGRLTDEFKDEAVNPVMNRFEVVIPSDDGPLRGNSGFSIKWLNRLRISEEYFEDIVEDKRRGS